MDNKKKKELAIFSIPGIIVLIAIILLLIRLLSPKAEIMTGTIETTVINAASIIPGRIDSIYVDLGDAVKKGEILAKLNPDIMDAKLGQASGVLQAAEGLVEKAEHGARIQQIQAARNQYEMARSQFQFAEKTYKRLQVLYADSIISRQDMDEMEFKYQAAKEQMEAAKSIYEMAKEGARKEDIKSAKGMYQQARSVYNEAKTIYKDLYIKAPVAGEISNKIAEEGEVVSAGYPVFTIQIPEHNHVVLNIREDKLPRFKIGATMKGKLIALNNKEFDFKVTYLSPLADFATWAPTREKGEFDLKTFEVHLKPLEVVPDIRPGMTVQIYTED